MDKVLATARKNLTFATVGVAIICALVASIAMYAYAEQRLQQNISAAKIGQLAQDNSELSAYIASQAPNHAHFETIAGIIQREDRNQITASLPFVLVAVIVMSGLAGWWLSRRLLSPVKEAYLSQRRFMQDAAHELRNPLAAMSTMLQQAKNRPPAGKELNTFIQSLGRQATHLSSITTDLLLLEHRDYPGTQEIDIAELLGDIVEELHHQAVAKHITVNLKKPTTLNTKIDPQHFVYIAKNVLENAIKFSDKKGKPIDVQLTHSKTGWTLKVRDYGVGIPKQDLPNITQRFYRAKNATNTDGTGLGMAIIDKFVSIYHGDVSITSTVGKGTTVIVTL
ncbi:MAG TPA: ATP-binding protein [Candidatus Saccharibacteria bacterium]|nr:ATP-binding protein [Candidatus Saccharibacteria bacterium]